MDRLEGNIATVGITEFAQGELGDIVYVDINTKRQGPGSWRSVWHGGKPLKP